MTSSSTKYSMGWVPDRPDFRDFLSDSKEMVELLQPLKLAGGKGRRTVRASSLPSNTDLRQHCSPIEDQENIGSCTANAGV